MKNIKTLTLISLLIISSISVISQNPEKSVNVLFVGNSYTAVNTLPQIVKDIAISCGNNLSYSMNTPGGCTFKMHTANLSAQYIINGGWDFVVLQEQSQLPAMPLNIVETECFPYAQILDSLVVSNNPCCETVFYMTWGRENGDDEYCQQYPPVCTYEGMDSLLYARYMYMAYSNSAIISPVGAVWHYIRNAYPDIKLYSSDGSHPSPAGSYAAACCFNTAFFRTDPAEITYNYTLNDETAEKIKYSTKTVMYDSLSKWMIGSYDSIITANFEYQIDSTSVSFINTTQNASSYFWNFGDDQTSTQYSPIHSYSDFGEYNVTLIAESFCGSTDTITKTIMLKNEWNDLSLYQRQKDLEIYPNPADHILYIIVPDNYQNDYISIYNEEGSLVKKHRLYNQKTLQIDIKYIPSGIYYVNNNKVIIK